jgi:hypothetical protein
VTTDQFGDTQPGAPLASGAGDFQHWQPTGDLLKPISFPGERHTGR